MERNDGAGKQWGDRHWYRRSDSEEQVRIGGVHKKPKTITEKLLEPLKSIRNVIIIYLCILTNN